MKIFVIYIGVLFLSGLFSVSYGQCDDLRGGFVSSDDSTRCIGELTRLTLSNYVGEITWDSSFTGSAPWGVAAGVTSDSRVVFPKEDVYYRARLSRADCADSISSVLFVDVLSDGLITGGYETEECGYEHTLSANNFNKGYWSKKAGSGTVSFSPDSTAREAAVSVSEYGFYMFAWTVAEGGCLAANVSFFEQNKAQVVDNIQFCGAYQESFELESSFSRVGATGEWTREESGYSIVDSTINDTNPIVTPIKSGTFKIKWRETYGACFYDSIVSFSSEIQPEAKPQISANVCSNSDTLKSLVASSSNLWKKLSGSGIMSFEDSVARNTMVSVSEYGNYEVQLLVQNGFCKDSAIIKSNFFEQPIISIMSDFENCGDSTQLRASISVGNGNWSEILGQGTVDFTSQTDSITSVLVSKYEDYIFQWIARNEICSDTALVKVNFIEQPIAYAGLNDAVCGSEYHLHPNVLHFDGDWFVSEGPGEAIYSPDSSFSNVKVKVSAFGIYNFMRSEKNGICADTSSVIINFFAKDSIAVMPDFENCGDSTRLIVLLSDGIGSWSQVSGKGEAVFVDKLNVTTDVFIPEFDTYVFQWKSFHQECSDSASIVVDFIEQPIANAGLNNEACGKAVNLNASELYFDGEWFISRGPGTATYIPDKTFADARVEVSEVGSYIFSRREVNGLCADTSSVLVSFINQPTVDAGVNQELDNIFETRLSASELLEGQKGSWILVSGFGSFSDISDPAALVSDLALGEAQFSWEVTSGKCSNADTVRVIVHDIFIPDVITPNNDSDNDYFVIKGVDDISNIELTVFNRWGIEVYYSSDYNNDWNGINKSGNDLTNDTYFYVVNINESRILKGFVVIKR